MFRERIVWNEEQKSISNLTDEEKSKARDQILYQGALNDLEYQIYQVIDESSLRKDTNGIRWVLRKVEDLWCNDAEQTLRRAFEINPQSQSIDE